jgi:hypothetical protein
VKLRVVDAVGPGALVCLGDHARREVEAGGSADGARGVAHGGSGAAAHVEQYIVPL